MDHLTKDLNAALTLVERKIITSHVYPPIPTRTMDWCAYFDDLGADCSPYGWGRTEAEARQTLIDNTEEEA
jgi:hypothetical protein